MSNVSINGVQLSWEELAKMRDQEIRELRKWRRLMSDLDRCEHGRHEGDICDRCGGASHGNPLTSDQIGYGLDGRTAIAIPPLGNQRNDPDKWRHAI